MSRLVKSDGRRFTGLGLLVAFLPACAEVRVVATKREVARPDVEVRRTLDGTEQVSLAGRFEGDALVVRATRKERCVLDTFQEHETRTEHRHETDGVGATLAGGGGLLAISSLLFAMSTSASHASGVDSNGNETPSEYETDVTNGVLWGSIGLGMAVRAGYVLVRSWMAPPPPPPPVVTREETPSRSREVDCGEAVAAGRIVRLRLEGAKDGLSVTTDATGSARFGAAQILDLWLPATSLDPSNAVELSVDGGGARTGLSLALPDDYARRHRQARLEALAATVQASLDESLTLLERDPPDLEAAQARLDVAAAAHRAAGVHASGESDAADPAKERLAEVAGRIDLLRGERALAAAAKQLENARKLLEAPSGLDEAALGLSAARASLELVPVEFEPLRDRRRTLVAALDDADRRRAAAQQALDEKDASKGDECTPDGDCEALCAAHQLGACLRWALHLQDELHQSARAYAVLERACRQSESGVACHYLATMTVRGQGVPANRQKGIALDRKGCALGNSDACHDANGLVCADMVRRGPRRPDVDPYCNPSWGRPALPWEPMPLKAHQMGYGGEVMESQSNGECFDLLLEEGCRLTRVARLGYVVAWCCPADLP